MKLLYSGTDTKIKANRIDIIVNDNEERTYLLINISFHTEKLRTL